MNDLKGSPERLGYFPRWTVTAHYRSNEGLVEATYQIEELAELHNLIEQGPSWYALDRI